MNGRSANRLIDEKSPYLLQHAHNPVDWYPWSAEAFDTAQTADKPVFLSIGYSTCHWCHVMEAESFENPEVAAMLNETFVCVKVDREERPDIDRIYMRVCQMMTGRGGWPLTLMLLPDKRPFFAATYIPRESRFGRVGMTELIPRVNALWATRRDELRTAAEHTLSALRRSVADAGVDRMAEELDTTTLDEAYLYHVDRYDARHGGFGEAPKFPSPHQLSFLLRYWKRTGTTQALRMVEHTLDALRRGGIYDHVGYGIHRYATDRRWLVPHFEKMLYDQATLTIAYVEAYQATGNDAYKATAREILAYVRRNLTSPDGGFYSAEDADVDGEEGAFYLWTEDELRRLLPPRDAELAIRMFNVARDGNFEEAATQRPTGNNILHLTQPLRDIAATRKIPFRELRDRRESIRKRLFTARAQRNRPGTDDKVLTDWNGLMIAALAKASRVFDEAPLADAAERAVACITENACDAEGRLYHRYRDGEAAIPGFLNDYAFLIWGLLELYETTFDATHLQQALTLTDHMVRRFWDAQQGGFYFTAADAENVLMRTKEIHDSAYPSGNAVAALDLLRLARMTGNPEYDAQAAQTLRAFADTVARAPAAHTHLLTALDFAIGPSYEVVIVGNPTHEDTNELLSALRRPFIPHKVVLLRPAHTDRPAITRYAAFTRELTSREGKATAYVCHDYRCDLPTTHKDELLRLLDASA